MQVRSCWSVLTKKAKDEEEAAQIAVSQAAKKIQDLQDSLARMNNLLDDYKHKALAAQAHLHSMAQTANNRQFILQLQDLISRVETDKVHALAAYDRAKSGLTQATHQRMKMETMQEKDAQNVKTWERKRDQKEMDALGLTLFNLKA
ncbi:MAG: flagellar export protein FliJ [Betaproteobacteria bacterium]|nr:flagellar export protein FliJ [Betaproteobacteria bacterium]